jgi:metallo-beta-lactamase family protein
MKISLQSRGGAREVTGSRHYLTLDDTTILVDCGAFQGKRKETDEKNRSGFQDAKQLTAMVLTHGHYDHCGLIPYLVKQGFKENIYTTPASRDIASLIMMDSAHIQARDKEYLAKTAAKREKRLPGASLRCAGCDEGNRTIHRGLSTSSLSSRIGNHRRVL